MFRIILHIYIYIYILKNVLAPLFGTVACDHIRVCECVCHQRVQMSARCFSLQKEKKKMGLNDRWSGATPGFGARLANAKNTSTVVTLYPRSATTYISEIPTVQGVLLLHSPRWNVWDGLMLRGRHNYFSLIFHRDFIDGSGAQPAPKTCQVRVQPVPGHVFTRCLGGGSRGSGGKS